MKTICEQCKYAKCDALEEPCKSGTQEMKFKGKCSKFKPTFKNKIKSIINRKE